jgi:hypothetical protein
VRIFMHFSLIKTTRASWLAAATPLYSSTAADVRPAARG